MTAFSHIGEDMTYIGIQIKGKIVQVYQARITFRDLVTTDVETYAEVPTNAELERSINESLAEWFPGLAINTSVEQVG